jgi:hypothetical protein
MSTITNNSTAAFTPVIEPSTQEWVDALAAATAGAPPPSSRCVLHRRPTAGHDLFGGDR